MKTFAVKKKGIVLICVAVALAAVWACGIFFPVLQVHEAERSGALDWEISGGQVNGKNSVDISFSCFDVRRKVTEVSCLINDDGTACLSVTTRGIPHFASYEEEPYRIRIPDLSGDFADDASPEIKKIVLESKNDSLVLWEEEVTVDRLTAQMFAIATDNKLSPDEKVNGLLTCFGADSWAPQRKNPDGSFPPRFSARLAETASRYDLTVAFPGDIVLYEKTDALREMRKCSCILIALIDDLDGMTWEYSFDKKKETLRFETSDAAAMLGPENGGGSIKEYGKTAGGLQKVMDAIGFEPSVFIG